MYRREEILKWNNHDQPLERLLVIAHFHNDLRSVWAALLLFLSLLEQTTTSQNHIIRSILNQKNYIMSSNSEKKLTNDLYVVCIAFALIQSSARVLVVYITPTEQSLHQVLRHCCDRRLTPLFPCSFPFSKNSPRLACTSIKIMVKKQADALINQRDDQKTTILRTRREAALCFQRKAIVWKHGPRGSHKVM